MSMAGRHCCQPEHAETKVGGGLRWKEMLGVEVGLEGKIDQISGPALRPATASSVARTIVTGPKVLLLSTGTVKRTASTPAAPQPADRDPESREFNMTTIFVTR